jgi:hypothetical protein
MLRVAKKRETRLAAILPIRKPRKLPVRFSYKYLSSDLDLTVFMGTIWIYKIDKGDSLKRTWLAGYYHVYPFYWSIFSTSQGRSGRYGIKILLIIP